MQILILSGSFRINGLTQGLVRAMTSMLSVHNVTSFPIERLPFYAEELDGATKPEVVAKFLAAVTQADGIVFCTPEYNHSIPAVLKNAIDWASRPAFQSPLKGKPVAIITQADSPVGGARAQAHLKLVLDSTLSRIHPSHEMIIGLAGQKFDQAMQLTDEITLHRLKRHLDDFLQFVNATHAER